MPLLALDNLWRTMVVAADKMEHKMMPLRLNIIRAYEKNMAITHNNNGD